MQKYRTLFIDLDDTLFDFKRASRLAFHEAYDLLGYHRFFESFDHFLQIYEPRNKELWQLYGKGEITKSELNRLRYSYPLEVVGHPDEALAATFCTEALGRIPHKNVLLPGAIELLDYLQPKYEMFILSNGFTELQSQKMQTTGLTKYFKRVILSEEININKPNIEIFEHALKVTNAKRESSIMIGDAFDSDIAGAANAGWDQIYFNRNNVKGFPFRPTYEVNDLMQIKEIL